MLKNFASYLLATVVSFSPATYAQQPSETQSSQQSTTPKYCTPAQVSQITSLHLVVSLDRYVFTLQGKINASPDAQEQCTLLEQKIIVGMKDWKTPSLETTIRSAQTYPFWFPTQNVLEDTEEKDPELYAAMQFNKQGRAYMPPGPLNPLGKVKFNIDSPYYVSMHGTPFRRFFAAEKRAFSHGCIRVEDEIALLKTLGSVAGSDCDETCIDNLIEGKKTKIISFQKPITIKVISE